MAQGSGHIIALVSLIAFLVLDSWGHRRHLSLQAKVKLDKDSPS